MSYGQRFKALSCIHRTWVKILRSSIDNESQGNDFRHFKVLSQVDLSNDLALPGCRMASFKLDMVEERVGGIPLFISVEKISRKGEMEVCLKQMKSHCHNQDNKNHTSRKPVSYTWDLNLDGDELRSTSLSRIMYVRVELNLFVCFACWCYSNAVMTFYSKLEPQHFKFVSHGY